jgi:hypothetical protein
LMVVVM